MSQPVLTSPGPSAISGAVSGPVAPALVPPQPPTAAPEPSPIPAPQSMAPQSMAPQSMAPQTTDTIPKTSNDRAIAPRAGENPESRPENPLVSQLRQPLDSSQFKAIVITAEKRVASRSTEGPLLIVTLAAPWFELTASQQNELAQSLWQTAQSLQVSQLQLRDSQGRVIARSPVVGDEMIVLLR